MLDRPEGRGAGKEDIQAKPISGNSRGSRQIRPAILTVVRAYFAGGEPHVDFIKLASFDAWARFVQRPLIWLGRAAPVQSVAISEEADPDRGGIAEVLAAWHNAIGDEPVTLQSLAAKAQAKETEGYGSEFLNSDLREALMIIAPNRDGSINTTKLAGWLRKNAGKIVSGLKVVRAGRDDHTQKTMWSIRKTGGLS